MLKLLFSFVFISILIIANGQNNFDVLHYKYSIKLNDNNDTIHGKAEITIRFLKSTTSVQFDLVQDKGKKGMKASPSTDDKIRDVINESDNTVTLLLSKTFQIGDTATLRFYYRGIPADGLIISKNKYGERTFFADNWPNRAHHWIPCIDRPDDKASFEFIIEAPNHYSVISNGIKVEERDLGNGKKLTHWKEDIPLPTKIMVIGVARFAVKLLGDSPPDIPVTSWVYPQDSVRGFANYTPAATILKFLAAYIGPYPYKKLANVQSKTIFGGMENASAIFYYEESATSAHSIETLLAHEITHQWFGDMASEKSFPHLWLSEGFATYFTHMYIESKYGTDSMNKRLQQDRQKIIGFTKRFERPVVDSISEFTELLNANSYDKGSWILHMLRRQLGDSVFHQIIRSYYKAYAGGNADTRDFEKICERIAGKDLKVFFDQWLYIGGVPKIEVEWKQDDSNKSVVVTVKQLQKKVFQFPLQLLVESANTRAKVETLSVNEQVQQFTISTSGKINRVYIDPNTSLLCEGAIREDR